MLDTITILILPLGTSLYIPYYRNSDCYSLALLMFELNIPTTKTLQAYSYFSVRVYQQPLCSFFELAKNNANHLNDPQYCTVLNHENIICIKT